METPVLIIAAVLFVLGMLVRKYPNLIAGYNTMTAEQKKNVDVKGLSNFMRRSLCVIAVLMIVSYFVMVARSVNEKRCQLCRQCLYQSSVQYIWW